MRVWFVDDRQDNRDTWKASFPVSVRDACELRTFASVPEIFAELDGGNRPDVLFVDYFLDGHDGMEVIERILADGGPTPLLIAHSSMPGMNEGMVRGGAHLAMEKVRGVRRTRSIVEAIGSMDDLRQLVARSASSRRFDVP